MSLYTLAFIGTVPWGNLFAGTLAQKVGVSHAFLVLGLMLLAAAALYGKKARKICFDCYIKQ